MYMIGYAQHLLRAAPLRAAQLAAYSLRTADFHSAVEHRHSSGHMSVEARICCCEWANQTRELLLLSCAFLPDLEMIIWNEFPIGHFKQMILLSRAFLPHR